MTNSIFGLVDFDKTLKLQDANFYKEDNLFFKNDKNQTKNINTITISFYGSIYNKPKDTDIFEFIYEKYKDNGIKFIENLDGVFSIVIYDRQKELLYIIKDRAGLQSLYFYAKKNSLIFGSRLKDFYNIPSFTKKIDKKALSSYLTYGYILQPLSIFEDTKKVKAGHFIEYDLKTKVYKEQKYWSLESCYKEKKILDEKETIKKVTTILEKSISKRLLNSKNFASSLSGGYDSSVVAALLKEQSGKKLDTFTIGFDDKNINEAHHAKKIASHLQTNHHEHYFSIKDAREIVPKLCKVYDEPFADYGATPTVLMANLVRENGFDTLFVGDGGDEVFATADDTSKLEKILNFPKPIKLTFHKLLEFINPSRISHLNKYQNIPTKHYKLLQILKAPNIPQMIKARNVIFDKPQIKKLLKLQDVNFASTFDDIDFPPLAQAVDQVIGTYFKTSMADAELVKSFGATFASNLDIKEPLLDLHLIEFMAKVPQSLKIKNDEKKYILKQIAHKYIPKNLLNRPKCGFDIPFSFWLKGELKELLFEQINELRLLDDDIFDIKLVLEIRDMFYSGKDEYKYKLWTIFVFQLWLEEIKKN